MRIKRKCEAPDCPMDAFARGYCRRHYGQLWRNGRIVPDQATLPPDANPDFTSLTRSLERTRHIYELAVGLPRRLQLRRKIVELEHQLALAKKGSAA